MPVTPAVDTEPTATDAVAEEIVAEAEVSMASRPAEGAPVVEELPPGSLSVAGEEAGEPSGLSAATPEGVSLPPEVVVGIRLLLRIRWGGQWPAILLDTGKGHELDLSGRESRGPRLVVFFLCAEVEMGLLMSFCPICSKKYFKLHQLLGEKITRVHSPPPPVNSPNLD